VLDNSGRLLLTSVYGPSNLLSGKEFEKTLEAVFKDICNMIRTSGKERAVLNISAGFSGTFDGKEKDRFFETMKRSCAGFDIVQGRIDVLSDALLALKVYFPHKPGLLLISGTGSVCYGQDDKGDIFHTGGLGYLLGDEGSGYWFGKEAVRAALRSKFHYKEISVIEKLINEHFGIENIEDVYPKVYDKSPKEVLSSASELVFKAAAEGCPVAEKIIKNGASELAGLVRNCSCLIGKRSGYVVLHGSVFKQNALVELLKKELSEEMNIYLSDKRIDLEAAKLLCEEHHVRKEA
jgi:N-acetylglucosamine kinase-like BadF-type ATPase